MKLISRTSRCLVVIGCAPLSFALVAMSCPDGGPATPDALFILIGIMLIAHLVWAITTLFVRNIRISVFVSLSLCCLFPVMLMPVFSVRQAIYFERYGARDNFTSNLVKPVPASVKNLAFLDIPYPFVGFEFQCGVGDMERIIEAKSLRELTNEELANCRFLEYPEGIPSVKSWITFQGFGVYDTEFYLRVCPERTHAIFIRK